MPARYFPPPLPQKEPRHNEAAGGKWSIKMNYKSLPTIAAAPESPICERSAALVSRGIGAADLLLIALPARKIRMTS